jgi:hypothetical protein
VQISARLRLRPTSNGYRPSPRIIHMRCSKCGDHWSGCQHEPGECPTICCWYGSSGDGKRHFPDAVVRAAIERDGEAAVVARVHGGEAP